MEGKWRWVAVTAVAPIVWGTNYVVTRQLLPADNPLWGSVLRALPAGLVLLAVTRSRPRGAWWYRSAVLGILNVAAFFTLIYVTAQRLPSSVASTVMATSAAVMMLIAWPLLSDRPRATSLAGALLGLIGVSVMLLGGGEGIDPLGIAASITAMGMSSLGFILTKKWMADESILAVTAWQLIAGGIVLTPLALLIERHPPEVDAGSLGGFAYVALVATALAYAAWFTGLRHLPAGTVGLVGLLNPVTGVILGTALAGERFGLREAGGAALVLAGVLIGQRTSPSESDSAPRPQESRHDTLRTHPRERVLTGTRESY